MSPLPLLVDDIDTPSDAHRVRAAQRQDTLTKPRGSLGRLEDLAVELCALQSTDRPRADSVPVVIFAGDHGVTAHGTSSYPSEVTAQMMGNFVAGGAAISVISRSLGLPLEVVDAGTLADPIDGVVVDKPCRGTDDFTAGPAMTAEQLEHALGCGERAVERAGTSDLLVLGEMGIGNTTAASAIASSLLDRSPAELVGPGAGLDAAGLAHKLRIVDAALALHGAEISDADSPALETMRRVGGLEIAALTGAIVAAARRGTPVVVDGFIVSVAALVATRLVPTCRPWLVFGTRSAEPGHDTVLDAMSAEPLLDLGLRLGEASGAALALPLLRAACELHSSMATFEEAAISGPAA